MDTNHNIIEQLAYAQKLLEKDPYLFQEKDSLFFKSEQNHILEINPYRGAIYADGKCVYGKKDNLRFGVLSFGKYLNFNDVYEKFNWSGFEGELKEISRDEVPLNIYLERKEEKPVLVEPNFRSISLEDLPDLINLYDRSYYTLGHYTRDVQNSINILTAENRNLNISFETDYHKGEVFMRREISLDDRCLFGEKPSSARGDVVLYGEFTDFDQTLSFLNNTLSKEPFKEVSLTDKELQPGYNGVLLSEVQKEKDSFYSFSALASKLEVMKNLNIINGVLSPENHLTFMYSPNPLNKELDEAGKYSLSSFSTSEIKTLKDHYERELAVHNKEHKPNTTPQRPLGPNSEDPNRGDGRF